MMRTRLGWIFSSGSADRPGRHRNVRSHGSNVRVEGLEARCLMTGGSVVLTPLVAMVTPSPSGPNTAIVSYQMVNGTRMLDVNLNGTDHDFGLTQVDAVYYMGSSASGAQTFQNTTSVHTEAWGGSGTNLFVGGPGQDEFIGGSGTNTFDAGSGYDWLIGGAGKNVFNESSVGSGVILETGASNTLNAPPGALGSYVIY
jgi:hypothetical protein